MTIPTGLVKSTIQASGAASSRARAAISSTTGTVRIALASPPGPVVSWPTHPQAAGICLVVEPRRLAADADLDQDRVGAVERVVEVAGQLERAGVALAGQHPPGQRADHLEPRGVDVVEHELASTAIRSRSRIRPETSSGVYVEPAPITARFIPSPPST